MSFRTRLALVAAVAVALAVVVASAVVFVVVRGPAARRKSTTTCASRADARSSGRAGARASAPTARFYLERRAGCSAAVGYVQVVAADGRRPDRRRRVRFR